MAKHVAVMNVQSASLELNVIDNEMLRLERLPFRGMSAHLELQWLAEESNFLSSICYPNF